MTVKLCLAQDPEADELLSASPFAMLTGMLLDQHDHMIIGRNEIAVQHMIKVFAQELGVALA